MENDIQKMIFRKMTPEQKWNAASLLIQSVRELKYAQFRFDFPDLSEKEIKEKVKKYFLYAST
jgi:hypothetical protein